MQPLSPKEISRFKNINLAKHYNKYRYWYVKSAQRIIKRMGKISPSKGEIFEALKDWLEKSHMWHSVLLQKPHILYKHYYLYTDTMARWIIYYDFNEITR